MERRIILLGKTGSGKSATGNTILRGQHFQVKSSPSSVTKQCVKKTSDQITVIDTPGIFDTSLSEEELKKEINKCINLSLPGPHVFLLVIKLGRFSMEERDAVRWIRDRFGERVSDHTIILFTGADRLGNRTIEEFIAESEELKQVLFVCGFRYHAFNNNDTDPSQVEYLMQKIMRLVRTNGGVCFTSDIYERAQRKKNWNLIKYVLLACVLVGVVGACLAGNPLYGY